ncbi:MAG: type II toxin-antitoxin system YoeB family toxin [Treponema sp.]|nr:type II toxin-antitoxin system YoeB family toxin [Candidatus Treponema equifaecale]
MSSINFSDKAWDDYLYWQQQDKKLMKKFHPNSASSSHRG